MSENKAKETGIVRGVMQPNPGIGYRLLKVGEPLTGAYLYLGGKWDETPQLSQLVYGPEWPQRGVFYRIEITDTDQAFRSWYGGMLWPTNDPVVHAEAAWKAAKEFYSKHNPYKSL